MMTQHSLSTAVAQPENSSSNASANQALNTQSAQFPTEEPSANRFPAFLQRERLEPILVVITACAVAATLLAEHFSAPAWLVLTINVISYLAGGVFGLQAGIKSLRHREINVDMLMVLAAIGAAIVNQWREGAILLFLFSLSNVLQAYAMDRSRNAIRALLKLRPNEATVRRGGELAIVPVDSLVIDDVIVIRPGERLPIDGEVVDGESTIDQSPITGESMPVTKVKGDPVFAGTVNQNGSLDVRVTKLASNTMLARIIKMVEEAQGRRASTQRFLDEFEQKYALFVIVSVLLYMLIPPLLFGVDFASNFYRSMVLMTVASPCALVISTPASILSAIANAARRGILFKGGVHLEEMATINVIAFDKTGTITTGRPVVVDVLAWGNGSQIETQRSKLAPDMKPDEFARHNLLFVAGLAESRSEHPIAQAVVQLADGDTKDLFSSLPCDLDQFEAVPGQGVLATSLGDPVLVGSERLSQAARLIGPG